MDLLNLLRQSQFWEMLAGTTLSNTIFRHGQCRVKSRSLQLPALLLSASLCPAHPQPHSLPLPLLGQV